MTFRNLWMHMKAKPAKYILFGCIALILFLFYIFEQPKISNYKVGNIESYSVLHTYTSKTQSYSVELRKIELLSELKASKLSATAKENETYLRATYRVHSDEPTKLPKHLFTFSFKGTPTVFYEDFLLNSLNANISLEKNPTAFNYTLSQNTASPFLSDDFTTYDLVSIFTIPKQDIQNLRIHLNGKTTSVFKKALPLHTKK